MPELFSKFPELAQSLPQIVIGSFPTPVEPLPGLCRLLGRDDLFIKRDDVSATPYGGNKVRKLEFLLADAQRQGAVRVITNGAAGSNHCLATALYAKRAGLRTTLILFDQPATDAVRGNLLMDAGVGAEMVYEQDYDRYGDVLRRLIKRYEKDEGRTPYVIPAGGSSAVGVLGYVNAGFELAAQIHRKELPGPVAIHLAFGTMGTVVGLAIGLAAAGMKSRIVASRVVPASLANAERAQTLFEETLHFLRGSDPQFPEVSLDAVSIRHDFFEPGYGLASKAVVEAVDTIKKSDDIALDITYTGKAFAAFLSDARTKGNGPLLFWNTKNSHPLPVAVAPTDYSVLPVAFHKFFH
jgi:D-cysteine desulfhydrase